MNDERMKVMVVVATLYELNQNLSVHAFDHQ